MQTLKEKPDKFKPLALKKNSPVLKMRKACDKLRDYIYGIMIGKDDRVSRRYEESFQVTKERDPINSKEKNEQNKHLWNKQFNQQTLK